MPTPKHVLKRIPTFSTEAAERSFWATADSTSGWCHIFTEAEQDLLQGMTLDLWRI